AEVGRERVGIEHSREPRFGIADRRERVGAVGALYKRTARIGPTLPGACAPTGTPLARVESAMTRIATTAASAALACDRTARRGLRRVGGREPGLRRVRQGRGFRYLDPAGRPVTNGAVLARIRALAIPPAWREVWICASPRGHLPAPGRDARGRKQYRYHAASPARRHASTFARMRGSGRAPPPTRPR